MSFFFFLRLTILNGQSELCWASLALFCNLVFLKFHIAPGEHCNNISILKACEVLKTCSAFQATEVPTASQFRQLTGLLQDFLALS